MTGLRGERVLSEHTGGQGDPCPRSLGDVADCTCHSAGCIACAFLEGPVQSGQHAMQRAEGHVQSATSTSERGHGSSRPILVFTRSLLRHGSGKPFRPFNCHRGPLQELSRNRSMSPKIFLTGGASTQATSRSIRLPTLVNIWSRRHRVNGLPFMPLPSA